MLIRGLRRLLLSKGLFIICIIIFLGFYDNRANVLPRLDIFSNSPARAIALFEDAVQANDQSKGWQAPATQIKTPDGFREIFSVSTPDKKYFPINFDRREAVNPNIIPHPFLFETWVIVAQQQKSSVRDTVWFGELVCDATFINGMLSCMSPPLLLPIAATVTYNCENELAYVAFGVGPRDARVFYGPRSPYVVYGSNSKYTCLGQFIQDFRALVDWGFEFHDAREFRIGTELQRPLPYGQIEKNWFVFWDKDEQVYAHYDIAPKRAFAKLEFDGSVGEDLAPLAAASDEKCMAKYMPRLAPDLESIHQATNSLSITLCKRSDPDCGANDSNTFILFLFHHKSFHEWHAVYEPYVMLFRNAAPFETYGISTKPLWIHGRGGLGAGKKPDYLVVTESKPWTQTEMIYITSVSWRQHGLKYHGHIDDVLFITFGIEDEKTGGIDVVAEDLLQDLGFCSAL